MRRLAIGACAALLAGGVGAAALALGLRDSSGRPRSEAARAATSPVASIQDDRLWQTTDVASRVRLMADQGAALIRVDLRWDAVATRRPARPRDPGDPAYDWSRYDRILAAARADGVNVLFTVWGTPAWAADNSVRAIVNVRFPAYTIRPRSAADFGDFGAAAASRYAPQGVRLWEAWNEPNIPLFLQPQLERQGGKWVATSPRVYSDLLKAFYQAVKSVEPDSVIGGGVTAPAGDRCPDSCQKSDARIQPTEFVRDLDAAGLRPPMDVYSHHPYPITPPRATTPPGRNYVDLYNLGEIERTLDATYLRGKRLWLSEFGFATRATVEYPTFVSKARQAAYLVDAYRRVRANPRVDLFTWYFLQDSPFWASGLLDGRLRPKPALKAFDLPVVAPSRVRRGQAARLLGQARSATRASSVTIERATGSAWRQVARVRTSGDGTFRAVIRPRATARYRARWSGRTRTGDRATRTSLAFTILVR